MIHELHEQGLSISAISRRTGFDRKTVRHYLRQGIETPVYGPRAPRPRLIDPFLDYLKARLAAHPQLSGSRLLREIRARGYRGGRTAVTDYLREIRPPAASGYEHRFETPPGHQAQVDFAHFKVVFRDEPGMVRVVWLFALVLGCSRYLTGEFVWRQNLETLVRCHLHAFEELGGVPRQILYDRMRTAVVGERDGEVLFHPTLLDLARHFGFRPRACAAYRAKTKGKVERPFRYVREDFFLAGEFDNLEHLNAEFRRWRSDVANRRCHGTTRRLVHEAFAEERCALQALPAMAYASVLHVERRISRDGMISVNGNEYSVPDTTQRRIVEVHCLADAIKIFEAGQCIAHHPLLEGRGQRRVDPAHRHHLPPATRRRRTTDSDPFAWSAPGERVAERSLAVYHDIGQHLARREIRP